MKRLYLLSVVILCGCGLRSSPLLWTSPGENTTLIGASTLIVKGASDTITSVSFYANDKRIGQAEATGDSFYLGFNALNYPEGNLTLRAIPNTGAPASVVVQIAHSSGSTVNTPEQPAGDDPSDSAVGEDPLNLGGLEGLVPGIAENPLGEAISHMPPFPWQSLLSRQLATQHVRRTLFPQQTAEPALLPRGIYTYNDTTEAWETQEAPFDVVQLNFSYVDQDGASHAIEALAWWDRYAQTTTVTQAGMQIEVPQAMWLAVRDTGKEILNVDVTVDWLTPEGCTMPVIVPEAIELDGWVNEERPLDTYIPPENAPAPGELFPAQTDGGEGGEGSADEVIKHILLGTGLQFSVRYDDDGGSDALDAEFYLDAVTDQDLQVSSYWLLETQGDVVIEDCSVTGGTLAALELYASLIYGPEGQASDGPVLNFSLSNLLYDDNGVPTRAHLESLLSVLSGDAPAQTTTVEGDLSLTDAGFEAAGTVTLPDDSTMTLLDYLTAIWEYYAGVATEAATP